MSQAIEVALIDLTLIAAPVIVGLATYAAPTPQSMRLSWEQEVARRMRRMTAIRQQTIRRMDEAEQKAQQ